MSSVSDRPGVPPQPATLGFLGSKSYAREELVAEMAGAFVCASLGIVPTVRHADYIGSWLEVLARIIAPSCAPRARHRKPPISCSPFCRPRSIRR